jgi:hypothetical protein
VLLTDLIPPVAGPRLTAVRAAALLRRVRTIGGVRRVRRELATDRKMTTLTGQVAANLGR